jgi:hypothetical protein
MAKVILISCASKKSQTPLKAKDIYISPLFIKAKKFAQFNADKWFILSAKHGLLDPECLIEPYDKTLLHMSKEQQMKWADKVIRDLYNVTSPEDLIVILAGEAYRKYIVPELKKTGYSVQLPTEGLSIGKQLQWLNTKIIENKIKEDLESFYKLLAKLKEGLGEKRLLGACNGKMSWPHKGVYFFFEEGEYRTNFPNIQRVVRVGTHAVSKGAVSTLWGRLRNHKGTPNGLGNHRGSIFRLHIGTALLQKMNKQAALPSWGLGQAANQDTKQKEEWLEWQVTQYLGDKMSLLWLDVGDTPSAFSDRAFIERNAIALISNNQNPIDSPSPNWLGNYSVKVEIRKSGLWNIRHVSDRYDPNFIEIFSEYVDITLGIKKRPLKSISPLGKNITNKKRSAVKQLNLFCG